jgi:anti-anti-sigma regulatory factor
MTRTVVRTAARGCEVELEGKTLIMTPPPDLPKADGQEGLAWASEVLGALTATPAKNVVVDLRRAGGFGPFTLGVYLRLWKSVRDRDGRMALCNVSHSDRELLSATSLDSEWTVCPTRDMALEAVKG